MGPANCAVIGCSNSTKKLQQWKKSVCGEHHQENCPCLPAPYRLFCFHSENRYIDNRLEWVKRLKRENPDKSAWMPRPSDRVCSKHFVDGEPTCANPYPTLELGYDFKQLIPRRKIFRELDQATKRKKRAVSPVTCSSPMSVSEDEVSILSSTLSADHSYCAPKNSASCLSCQDKREVIKSLTKKMASMSVEIKHLKSRKETYENKNFTWKKIKNDKKVLFYTGLPSIQAFNKLFSLIEPSLQKITYWRGIKRHVSSSSIKRKFVNCSKMFDIVF